MFDQKDIQAFNTQVEIWNERNVADVRGEIDSLGIKRYKFSQNPLPLIRAFNSKIRKQYDAINKITYTMPRSAIFLHKGVGRGHGKNNPRTAKEWFQPIVNKNLDELSEIVADNQGDMILNALKIK